MKRRKSKAERKESTIMIRLTAAQKATIVAVAKDAGLGVSGWILSRVLEEVQKTRKASTK